jgi:DNA-binding transcriptional MerR regulator
MRISELSRHSGVTVPTIKFYLREGLLPPGRATGRTSAEYDREHLHRLRLVRVLLEVGRLPLAAVRDVLAALGNAGLPLHDTLAVAHRALSLRSAPGEPPDAAAAAEVDRLVEVLGWAVGADSPPRRELAAAVAALRRLGWQVTAETFVPYARALDPVAAREVEHAGAAPSRAEAVERLVVGTVVFEVVLAALRRLAHERHSALRYGSPDEGSARR